MLSVLNGKYFFRLSNKKFLQLLLWNLLQIIGTISLNCSLSLKQSPSDSILRCMKTSIAFHLCWLIHPAHLPRTHCLIVLSVPHSLSYLLIFCWGTEEKVKSYSLIIWFIVGFLIFWLYLLYCFRIFWLPTVTFENLGKLYKYINKAVNIYLTCIWIYVWKELRVYVSITNLNNEINIESVLWCKLFFYANWFNHHSFSCMFKKQGLITSV